MYYFSREAVSFSNAQNKLPCGAVLDGCPTALQNTSIKNQTPQTIAEEKQSSNSYKMESSRIYEASCQSHLLVSLSI